MSSTPLKKIAINSLIALGVKTLSISIAFGINIVLARLYGPELMGTFFIAFNIVLTLSIVCRLGMDNGLLHFASVLTSERRHRNLGCLLIFSLITTLSLGLIITFLIYLGKGYLAELFHAPYLSQIMVYFMWAVPCYAIIFILQETVRGLGAVRWAVWGQYILIPGTLLAGLVILPYLTFTKNDYALSAGSAFLICNFIGLIFFGRKILTNININAQSLKQESFRNLLQFSLPLLANAILQIGLSSVDSLILGLFTSPKEVAYYGAAVKTAMLISFPLLAINAIIPPVLGRYYQQGDIKNIENVSQSTTRWMFMVALPIALLIILLSEELLSLFNQEFIKAKYALWLLSLGQIINVGAGPVGYILIMTGNQRLLMQLQLINTIFTFPLMLLGAFWGGLMGITIAYTIGIILINLLMALGVQRRLGIKSYFKAGYKMSLTCILASMMFIIGKYYYGIFIGLILFSLIYISLELNTFKKEIKLIIKENIAI